MKKLLIISACFCGILATAQEQDSIRQKMKWANMIQIGQLLDGNEGVTGRMTASWVSGVQINKLTAGIALGINGYDLFTIGAASLYGKYKIFENKISPYGYGIAGYGLPMYFREDSQLDATSSKGGILYGVGIGMDIPIGKASLLFQLGYKFQKTTYDEPTYYYYSIDALSSFAPYNGENYTYTTRKMNRVEFKIGVQF